jgi:hypothetical protein
MTLFIHRWLPQGMALATAAALCLSAVAEPPKSNLLDDARKTQEIATQKAESDLRMTLNKANSAGPSEAVRLLKDALSRIENNDDINPDRRTSMVRMLKDRIRITDTAAKVNGGDDRPIADASKQAKLTARKADLQKQAEEREKIKAAISAINQLQGKGQTEEADRQARDLAKQFPDNSAARAMGRNGFMNARVREGRELLSDQEKRHAGLMRELDKSTITPAGDVEFDKKRWADASKRSTNKLSEKEKKLLASLNEPVQANWKNSRFEDVIEFLSTASGQTIILDKKAMEEQEVTYESPVNFVAPKTISFRSALRKVLADKGLTFVIKEEMIYVTTPKAAREMMVTRVYPIGDLVSLTEGANGVRYHPAINMQAEAESAKFIIDMIKDTIDPQSWVGNTGAGSITYSPLTKALVIRQSAEVHMMLKSGLK